MNKTAETSKDNKPAKKDWFERFLSSSTQKIAAVTALVLGLSGLIAALSGLKGDVDNVVEGVVESGSRLESAEQATEGSVCQRNEAFCEALQDFVNSLSETEKGENDDDEN